MSSSRYTFTAPHRVRVDGTASDRGCGHRVARIKVSVAKQKPSGTCRYLHRDGSWSKAQACGRKHYVFTARGTTSWRFATRAKLGRGHYVVQERAVDRAGNVERVGRRNDAVVRVRRA